MSQSQAMNAPYFLKQARYWFVFAVVIFIAWLLLWIFSGSSDKATQKKQAEEQAATTLPNRINGQLVDLKKEVRPIDFSTIVRDMRSYPLEFKDKFYYENISNRVTIELMDVVENEVIVNYLNNRQDRDQFTYFRYLDSNKKPHYVLTYGKFQTQQEAEQNISTMNFGLPESVKPKTAKISDYLKIIDNYMRAEGIADLAVTQPRRIMLQATGKEIPVQAATRADADLVRRSQAQQERIRKQAEQDAKARQEAQQARMNAASANVNTGASIAPTAQVEQPTGERSTPLTQNTPVEQTPETPRIIAPTAQPTANAERAEPKAEGSSE